MEADTASTYVIEIIMSKLMIGLMGEGDSEHPLVSPVSSHTTRAINDFTMAPPVGVNSQINKPQFSKTVTKKLCEKIVSWTYGVTFVGQRLLLASRQLVIANAGYFPGAAMLLL